MTTILIISVGASSLHAVARDPAVQLRVDVTQVGQPDTRYVVDDQPIVARPETGDLAGAISLVAALAGSRGITVAAVAHRVGHEAAIHLVPEVIDDALIAIVGDRPTSRLCRQRAHSGPTSRRSPVTTTTRPSHTGAC